MKTNFDPGYDYIADVENTVANLIRGDETRQVEAFLDKLFGVNQLWLNACHQAALQPKVEDKWALEYHNKIQNSIQHDLTALLKLPSSVNSSVNESLHAAFKAIAEATQTVKLLKRSLLETNPELTHSLVELIYNSAWHWQNVHPAAVIEATSIDNQIKNDLAEALKLPDPIEEITKVLQQARPEWLMAPVRDLWFYLSDLDVPKIADSPLTVIQTVLLDCGGFGLVADLHLEALPGGLGQCYPAPQKTAFFQYDHNLHEALKRGLKFVQLEQEEGKFSPDLDVRWWLELWPSKAYSSANLYWVEGGSIGAGFAMALWHLLDSTRPALDRQWAITGAINESGKILGVAGYRTKLLAATEAKLKVIVPGDDLEKGRKGLSGEWANRLPNLKGARTVEEASQIASLTRLPGNHFALPGVLSHYPYPVALAYRHLLEERGWRDKLDWAIQAFEFGLRTMALIMVSQYLNHNSEQLENTELSDTLKLEIFEKYPENKSWLKIFFEIIKVYRDHRNLLFTPEFYNLYWESSQSPAIPRLDLDQLKEPYEQLINLIIDNKSTIKPTELKGEERLEKAIGLLNRVLEQFNFIERYTLIQILANKESGYEYSIYKGEKLTLGPAPLYALQPLEIGQFYLIDQYQQYLQLHPMLVLWETASNETNSEGLVGDAGIYEKYTSRFITYAYVGQADYRDNTTGDLLDQFRLILKNFQERKQRNLPQVQRLNWELLKKVTTKVADKRFPQLEYRYTEERELYLQRREVKEAFEDFLNSNKTAFLLLGKSGVGKSSFFLSMVDEYRPRTEIGFLLYNAAKLESGKTLAEIIRQDFEEQLRLVGQVREKSFESLLEDFSQIEDIEHKQIVLFVDAINENNEAKNLLIELNDIIEKAAAYPWFKVAFSSRPEAWKAIKRNVPLADIRFYQKAEQLELGVELQPFSTVTTEVGFQMRNFRQDELEEAYNNYRHKFKLQTAYPDVTGQIRQIITDPLDLRIVAKTYEGQTLPSMLSYHRIYEDYLAQLVENRKLTKDDLAFLEGSLMPLMIYPEHLDRAVSDTQISFAAPIGEFTLYKLINSEEQFSKELFPGGRWVNQSFRNLVAAEILVKRGPETDYEVGFKYERFYDYFGGRRLFKLAQAQPAVSLEALYLGLIKQTLKIPYLWGPVKNALLLEARGKGVELLIQLCMQEEQRVKELMVKTLEDLGQDSLQLVEKIMDQLLPEEDKPTALQRTQQAIFKSKPVSEKGKLNSQRIAVEVAGSLGIIRVLRTAALLQNPTLRTDAVRHSYLLWQREPEKCYRLYEGLAREVMHGLVPDLPALESVFGFSLVVFFSHNEDKVVMARLRALWREVIGRLFKVKQKGWANPVRDFLRETIFSFGVQAVFRIIEDLPAYNPVNYADLDSFFKGKPQEKELIRRLARYMDVEAPFSAEKTLKDLLDMSKSNELLISGIATLAFGTQLCYRPKEVLPLIEASFETILKDPNPHIWVGGIPFALTFQLDRNPNDDVMFKSFVNMIEIGHEYNKDKRVLPFRKFVNPAPAGPYYGPYLNYQYRREGTVAGPWLESRIQKARLAKDDEYFIYILSSEISIVAFDSRLPRPALDALKLFFDYPGEKVQAVILKFLARMRLHFPDETDDFLAEQKTTEEYQLKVKTNEPVETVGELIGTKATQFFVYNVGVERSPILDEFIMILEKAAEFKRARDWLAYIGRHVVNLLYGEKILNEN